MTAGVDSDLAGRRRVERALHDGPVQDLVALSVQLQLLRGLLEEAPPDALTLLDEIRREVAGALDRLRAIASEVYPAILDARGLADAIRMTSREMALVVRIDSSGVERYVPEVEAAVFFACRSMLERLEPGAEVAVVLRQEADSLQLEVAAAGVDPGAARDLVAAAGGSLTVDGARVVARFPLGSQPSAAR